MFALRRCRPPLAGLRSLSSSTGNTKNIPLTSSLTDFRMRIMAAANMSRSADCFQLARSMKEARVSPDVSIYNALLSSTTQSSGYLLAWAIFDDMVRAGVTPDATTFVHLIQAQRSRSSEYLMESIKKMNELQVTPTSPVYSAIISAFVSVQNLEGALQYYFIMQSQDMVPELSAVQELIAYASDLDLPRLAVDIASHFEHQSQRQLEASVWLACLYSSAKNLYMEGVTHAWPIVVQDLGIAPNEGLCMSVLHTAARHGAPDLATDVLGILKLAGVQWNESHFSALVEAFCSNDQLKEALVTLQIMTDNDMAPTKSTTEFLIEHQLKDTTSIDIACSLLDEIKKEGGVVPLAAAKVTLQASARLGDLQRTVGVYKSLGQYDLKPDIEIFHLLLDGCISAHHRSLGDLVLDDMKSFKVSSTVETYTKVIQLCLTQETYEEGFFYLEEMKAAKFKPPRQVYLALVEKCWSAGDARANLVLEEMKECGYSLPKRPRSTESSVKNDIPPPPLSHNQPSLDSETSKFIDTGGLNTR